MLTLENRSNKFDCMTVMSIFTSGKKTRSRTAHDAFPLWKLCSIGICPVCDCLQMFGAVSIIVINRYINLLGRTYQEIKKTGRTVVFPNYLGC